MADPLRRTLSKLRGKKSKQAKAGIGSEPPPGDSGQGSPQHPYGNHNNNNYREGLWEDARATMTKECLAETPRGTCSCAPCKASRAGCPLGALGAHTTTSYYENTQDCINSGPWQDVYPSTTLNHTHHPSFTVPQHCSASRSSALTQAPMHQCSYEHVYPATGVPMSGDNPYPRLQGVTPTSPRLQNGFARVEWPPARGFTPSQAYHLYASLQQSYRRSIQSQHSVDSDEDDYYDNDNLPYYEPEPPSQQSHLPSAKTQLDQHAAPRVGSEETDRLRTRLQEAYHLLIHAMQDMPGGRDSPMASRRYPSSAHSQDSVCTQSSHRAAESDIWSSGEASPQQVSDTEYVAPVLGVRGGFFLAPRCSKSLEALCRMPTQPLLHRCLSDSGIQYSAEPAPRPQGVGGGGDTPPPAPAPPLSRPYVDSEGPRGMFSRAEGPCAPKTTGVTVRKMQKWMYKGRLLSLEMRERIIGSSLRGPCSPPRGEGTPKAPAGGGGPGNPLDDRGRLTDLIENVYASSLLQEDLKVVESNEQRQQNNSITVSKKRNWLQQSTQKPTLNDGYDFVVNAPGRFHPEPAFSSPEPQRPPLLSRLAPELPGFARPQDHPTSTAQSPPLTPMTVGNSSLDLSDDNDADDEGEIWYNPIPEDEEHDVLGGHGLSGNNSLKPGFILHKKLPRSDLIKTPGRHPGSTDSTVDAQTAPLRETNQPDSTISSQHCTQPHKQRFVNRLPMRTSSEEQSSPKSSDTGFGIKANPSDFSPPSSPSPLKKVGPMNWSFPDKIKSPRTVRKLSMKMKKIPELSRKLSVKGTSSHTTSENSSSAPKNNFSNSRDTSSLPARSTAAASRNVISRYHLDSSVSSQHSYKKKNSGNSKSSSKGGYLSDGDSPELLTKSGKHGSESRSARLKEAVPTNINKTDIDIDAFRHYTFSDQPKCSHYISGLMSVHFYGAEDLKPPRLDTKDVFCAIQVDSINKARTALLTCRTPFLDMDHTFNIDLENAQHLKLVVFSWDPAPRKNRVCCHGTVVLPTLFRVTKMHQLAVKLEPRGLIYVKVTLMDQWENSFNSYGVNREPVMFGVDARKVVEMENVGLMVPLLMEKCIEEIEKRGCQVVGLYRLCGSAAVKKELREAFERDSKSVVLCENLYPDINVITGVLKDYLRELPSPLITKHLYEAVLNAMAKKPLRINANCIEMDSADYKSTVGLLDCLPDVEKATLKMLLDHLKRVASYHEVNKMTCQNLAVCFGPVLLSQRQETSNHNNRVFTDSEELASALDFKKHIEVLHYLLQMWPVQNSATNDSAHVSTSPEQQPYLRRKKQRPQVLDLNHSEMTGMLRPRPIRLDSPSSNRYAGDWSSCGENYFLSAKENLNEADYDDVPSEDLESGEESFKVDKVETAHPKPVLKESSFDAYLAMRDIDPSIDPRVDLQDLQESIDNLIGSLERELNKNKSTITY